MNFLKEFKNRGFFHQCTDATHLASYMQNNIISAYIGFDCTAKSLHVGSLMQLMILRMLQKHGHRPIIIIGGGTSKIGDPTFKDKARQMLAESEIKSNIEGITKVIKKFVDCDNKNTGALILDNDQWLSKINYLEFLREFGPHFSINRMLTFDSVKLRLEREQNLSFLEFNYMLLQSYDFVRLAKDYNCRLQIGGSDQWGNIVSGIELNRKMHNNINLFGLTTPLITTSSGAKMGKTVSGAVWLSEDMLSPYGYYQFWRNTEDADVIRFLKFFTELPLDEIAKYEKIEGKELNEVKKILAYETTKLCHGANEATKAQDTAQKTFEQGVLANSLPEYIIDKNLLEKGIHAYMLFSISGLTTSGGEAKRLIKGKGGKINRQVINDPMQNIDLSYLENGVIQLSSGKKKHLLVKISSS